MKTNRLSPRPPALNTKAEKAKKGAAKRDKTDPLPDSTAVKSRVDSPHARRKTVVKKLRTPEDSAGAVSSSPEREKEVSQLKNPIDNKKEKIGTVRGATGIASDDEE